MTEFGDRLVILLFAGTGLAVFVLGWTGGYIEAFTAGWTEIALIGVLVLLFAGILIAIWKGFDVVDEQR